ncbi:MAG: 50S ribosomal protein L34e [Candidatus Aenigmarchaeota archaeon]|nr:50S ribosomal protein L34e [Candidatus Aenigmarchaeota archaeon]
MKKVKRRTPKGRISIQRKREKPSVARCATCKMPLHGIPKLTQNERGKLAKSQRVPSRPYGGNLCADCSREVFRERTRII